MNANATAFVPGQSMGSVAREHGRAAEDVPRVATTEDELRRLLQLLASEPLLCVDCEGADLSKGSWRNGQMQSDIDVPLHGRICLIQLGTSAGEAYAIDLLQLGQRAFELGLGKLLESEQPVKVVHDFRQDADALWHQFGVSVGGLFDCQLCDIFLRRLQGHKTAYVQGSAKLLSAYGVELGSVPGYGLITQEKKQAIHERFSQDRHLWERRPLPEDMLEYALQDVRPMPQLHFRLLQSLAQLLPGGEEAAWQLVLAGSFAYAQDFASQPTCRCRLCCNASENARFDGHRLLTRMAAQIQPELLQWLWRPEDNEALSLPGPSRFCVNEHDESVPLPGY
ncbi:unnamed protein product [Polarella glacialis]|uniref:3'-5' exonuclease domain-containing protein n=1 Tax=Polarella glacialis TaxID=89957 RepID=A0A813I4M1_POLGL|nr:unnamed protein product [Polarella glacialis]CAE8644695.1 unnamed protein product [Polarella glacialis]